MIDDKKTPKPGVKKVPPRPSEPRYPSEARYPGPRMTPLPPRASDEKYLHPRMTPLASKAVNPDDYKGSFSDDYERSFSDLPVDGTVIGPAIETAIDTRLAENKLTESEPANRAAHEFAAQESAPAAFLGLSPAQLQLIAEQLKGITVSTIKSSLPPPKPNPSIPARATKAAGKGAAFISVGVMAAGFVVEWAARKFLGVDGPWTEFIVTFGQVLMRAGS